MFCKLKLDHKNWAPYFTCHEAPCCQEGEHNGGPHSPSGHASGEWWNCPLLQCQANVCQYNIECPNCSTIVDFTDCILWDALAKDITYNEIQLDLLGNTKQDMTLKEMLKFLESKESGKCSASHLHDSKGSQAVAPATDCDDRPLKTAHQNQVMSPNSALTASGKFMDRSLHPAPEKNECSAYNHTCSHCNHLHHFEIVCCNKGKPKPSFMTIPSLNRVVFNSLCSLSSPSSYHSSQCPISLDHHTYNQLTDTLHGSVRPSNLNPLSKSLWPSQPVIMKLLDSWSQSK